MSQQLEASPAKPGPLSDLQKIVDDDAKAPVTIWALPSEVLGQALSLLPLSERVRTALVCRRWAALGRASRSMWTSGVCLELSLAEAGAAERSEAFVSWVVPRAANLSSLGVTVRRGGAPPPPPAALDAVDAVEAVVLSNVTAALAVAGPNLRDLSVEWDGTLVLSGWTAALTALRVASFAAEELTVRPGMGGLPALRDLRLRSVSAPLALVGPPAALLPQRLAALRMDGCRLRALPPAVASLRHLTDLVLSNNALGPADLDPLSRMTSLQQLTLMGTRMARLPPALSALTNLRVLYLDGVAGVSPAAALAAGPDGSPPALPPHAAAAAVLAPLRHLGILSLGSSRLSQFPEELADLSSLRVLYLDNNPALAALPDGPYLRRLRVLGIDWRVLFASHSVLSGAPLLRKLCLTSLGGVEEVDPDERDATAVATSLLSHPSLSQVLLPMVDGNRTPLFISALNVALALAASPRIAVEAVTYGGISNEWIEFLVDLEAEEEATAVAEEARRAVEMANIKTVAAYFAYRVPVGEW